MTFPVLAVIAGLLLTTGPPFAPHVSELAGRVLFSGLGVPGAIVTAVRGERSITTVSDDDGVFRFADLDAGTWTVRVEMRGFATASRDVTLPAPDPPLTVTLTMRAYEEIVGSGSSEATPAPAVPPRAVSSNAAEPPSEVPDIINGSVSNGGATPFAQPRAFGNNRPRQRALYTGGLNAVLGNSAWNAQPYSFGEAAAPAPDYSDVQVGFTLGGPMRIPWLITYGPQTVLGYQRSIQHDAITQSALMPTTRQRAGDFSQSSSDVLDPLTGLPFPGNRVPPERISSQATALLAYYPRPNAETTTGANYQQTEVTTTTQDVFQLGMNQNVGRRNALSGTMTFQRTVTDSVNLFDFADTSRQSSLTAGITWQYRFSLRSLLRARYQLSRTGANVTPFFAHRTNVSGDAGIAGNDQTPDNWGPPTLSFPDIAGLRDVVFQDSQALTHSAGAELALRRGRHNLILGGDVRWIGLNVSSHPDPRGTLSFTGAVTGDAWADFLVGVPTTSSIAFGNARTRLRAGAYDAYFVDDFRVGAGVTLNLGVRWEYDAPFTEADARLVNLDVAPGFTAISPVLAANPVGTLTGRTYPASLLWPDKRGIEPRLAASWRPMAGSSLVIRAGYGVYRNLGVYQPLALLLAQQPPFSTVVSVENSPLTPLTLANPFPSSLPGASNTYAVDPGFRPAYAHSWNVTLQRDLPASLTVIAAYLGDTGVHLMQAFLPNTVPAGAGNPCPACPSGFVYVTSNGRSRRNAGQFTIRRRLYRGLMASAQYTISTSTDDAATFSNAMVAPGSLAIAQNWLDLPAERGPSSFDQPHLVSVQFQYTTGVGVTGGTLVDGVQGALFKDWTLTSQLNAGSGFPLTPVLFSAVPGTGFVGVRPRLTGVSPAPLSPDAYANAAAYDTPFAGTWGDAGRNSIRGPSQFSLDLSVSRVFRLRGRLNLEWRVAATNVLNKVTFATIDTVVTSPQFGLPTRANPMRRLQTTFRLRF